MISIILFVGGNGKRIRNLAEVLTCIYNQTFKDYEIILVEQNLDGKKYEIYEGAVDKYICIKNTRNDEYCNAWNGGWVRNVGAKSAIGQKLLFLESDIIFDNDFLQKVNDYDKKAFITWSKLYRLNEEGTKLCIDNKYSSFVHEFEKNQKKYLYEKTDRQKSINNKRFFIPSIFGHAGGAVCYDKDFYFNRFGGHNESYFYWGGGDNDAVIRWVSLLGKFNIMDYTIFHLNHGRGVSGGAHKFSKRFEILKKTKEDQFGTTLKILKAGIGGKNPILMYEGEISEEEGVEKDLKPIWHFGVISSNRGDQAITLAIEDLIKAKIDIPIAHFSCKHELLDDARIKQLNDEASILLIAGSGLYTNYPLESNWYFRCNQKDFKKINVPIVLFGIGSNNHLSDDRFKPLYKKTLKSIVGINERAVLSGVRDYRTLRIIKESGIDKVCLTPDPAMFINPIPYKEKLEKPTVGISIAQHCSMLKQYRQLLLKIFARLCWLLDEKGINVIFIAHDCLEHNLYLDLKKYYPNLMYYNENKPREMAGLYQELLFSVGVRCHSNIISFGMGTPFISLIYDQKTIEFLKIIGFPELGIKIDSQLTFNDLKEKVMYIIENLNEIKEKMKNKKDELRKIEDDFINEIVKVIKNACREK